MTSENKQFLLNMWLMNRLTIEQLATSVTKGKITQAESDEISATSR